MDRILFTAPYLLNPEIRYSRWAPIRHYLGYSVNLVHDDGFKPAGAFRMGLVFDHFKSQIRIKAGYEVVRLGREIERSIQVGLALGINDDL